MLLLSSHLISLNQGDVLRRKQYYQMVHLVYFSEVPIRKVPTLKNREELMITTDWILVWKYWFLQGLWIRLCGSECLLCKHDILHQIPSNHVRSWVWLDMWPLQPQWYTVQWQEDGCGLLATCLIPGEVTAWLQGAKWRVTQQNTLCLLWASIPSIHTCTHLKIH